MKYTAADFPEYAVDMREPQNQRTIDWIFTGIWSPIDNFHIQPFWYRPDPDLICFEPGFQRVKVQTSEHAFQAMKAKNKRDFMRIAKVPNPHMTKAMGQMVDMREDWSEVRYDVMADILRQKFAQLKKPRDTLNLTGNRPIIEGNQWNDRVWGMTLDEQGLLRGQNALGKMLVLLREGRL